MVKKSNHVQRKVDGRLKEAKPVDPELEAQFSTGRLFAQITSRPGQCGRCDGCAPLLSGRLTLLGSRASSTRSLLAVRVRGRVPG